jgi:hypothetical protein
MSSQISYLDGNAAAGELSKIFDIDGTCAESQCAQAPWAVRQQRTRLPKPLCFSPPTVPVLFLGHKLPSTAASPLFEISQRFYKGRV